MVAPNVKPASEWGTNYRAGIPRASGSYASGVRRNTNQNANAVAAQALWVQKISDPAVQERRVSGLNEAGQGKWQRKALDLGARNIGPGMTAGASDYDRAASTSASALGGVNLQPKTADFRTNIANNVTAVVEALKKAYGKG